MQTNYQNLDFFEACTVVLAICGLGLIGLIGLNSLPDAKQSQVAAAFEILDAHEQVAGQIQAMREVEFNLGETVERAADQANVAYEGFYGGFLDYADVIAAGYEKQNSTSPPGSIAGVWVEVNNH